MEDLIMHAHILYDEQPSQSSPPLPPTPAGEPVPHYPYGSKSTRVANVPGTPTHTSAGSHVSSSPQDFTPRLPPRPTNSIHPSLRAHPQTPTRGRTGAPSPLPLRPGNLASDESPLSSPSFPPTLSDVDETTTPEVHVSPQSTAQTLPSHSSPPRHAQLPRLETQTYPDSPPVL